MNKVLVTGANGFLGKYIVEQLVESGREVRTLTRRSDPELEALGVESTLGDIRDTEKVIAACKSIETVYHVAAVAGIWGPWEHFHGINAEGTHNILKGCEKHSVRKLVYTSSPSVVFDRQDHCNADESAPYPTKWLCHYPHTKAIAEKAVLDSNSDSFFTCALRPHLIWGPRDNHLIPRLITRAKSGRLRRVGDGTNLVDCIYVENAADAHLLAEKALDKNANARGRAYFISQERPVNCWEWIDEILALADLPPVKKSISLNMAKFAGRVSETAYGLLNIKSEPLMTRFLAMQLAMSHYFDNSAAREELGYNPAVSIEQGMQRLKDWMDKTLS